MRHNWINTETQADIKVFGKIDDFSASLKLLLLCINAALEKDMGIAYAPCVDGHVKVSQKWSFGIEPLGE